MFRQFEFTPAMGAFFGYIVDGLTALAADLERNLKFVLVFGDSFPYALVESADIVLSRSFQPQGPIFPAESQFQGGRNPTLVDPDMIEFSPGIIVDLFLETE